MILCFKHRTAYEWRISDWSSDVCSSDLPFDPHRQRWQTIIERIIIATDRDHGINAFDLLFQPARERERPTAPLQQAQWNTLKVRPEASVRRNIGFYEAHTKTLGIGPLPAVARNIVRRHQDFARAYYIVQHHHGASHDRFAAAVLERAMSGEIETLQPKISK